MSELAFNDHVPTSQSGPWKSLVGALSRKELRKWFTEWPEEGQPVSWKTLRALRSRAGVREHFGRGSGGKCFQLCGPSVSAGLLGSAMTSMATEQFINEFWLGSRAALSMGRGT